MCMRVDDEGLFIPKSWLSGFMACAAVALPLLIWLLVLL